MELGSAIELDAKRFVWVVKICANFYPEIAATLVLALLVPAGPPRAALAGSEKCLIEKETPKNSGALSFAS